MNNSLTRKAVALLASVVIVIQLIEDSTLNILLVVLLGVVLFYNYNKYKSKARSETDKKRDKLLTELMVTFAEGLTVIICFLYTWAKAFEEGGLWIGLAVVSGLIGLAIGNRLKENLESTVRKSKGIKA